MLRKRTKSRKVDKRKAAGTRSRVSKKPWECKAYRDYVKVRGCLVCGRAAVEAHHIREKFPRTMGRRISDAWVVPLCQADHAELHRHSRTFWTDEIPDPVVWCQATHSIWARYSEEGRQAIAELTTGVGNE